MDNNIQNKVLNLRRQTNILFTSLSALTFIIFGYRYILTGELLHGVIEALVGTLLFLNLFLLKNIKYVNIAGRITVSVVMAISMMVFFHGGINLTGNLWIILVPMFPLMLLPYKEGKIWMFGYILLTTTVILSAMADIIELKFDVLQLRQTLIVFILFNFLIYFNEKVKLLAWETMHNSQVELQKKEKLMFEQSKSAQMGEMMSMVAHQWRQPINAISASAMQLELKSSMNILKEDEVNEASKFIQNETQEMSQVINDFMNFFKQDSKKSTFDVEETYNDMLKLVSPQLKSHGIEISFKSDNAVTIYGHKKQFIHILLNLVGNARDALKNSNTNPKEIYIEALTDKNNTVVRICDNGPGIDENIIDRVFDPYFTTKLQGEGTGIGLYMVKQMIENDFHAKISVKNMTHGGASFTIYNLKQNNI